VATSTRLAVLSVLLAIGAIAAYVLLLRVAMVRNHPEGYVIAFALATALAALAVARARGRRWPAWLALGFTSLLLVAGAWFNFVVARVPDAPTALRVGERPPDFTLPDPTGRPVTLADFRGKKPVVLVFYRGSW
jgi:AhpC/TSA family